MRTPAWALRSPQAVATTPRQREIRQGLAYARSFAKHRCGYQSPTPTLRKASPPFMWHDSAGVGHRLDYVGSP
eukprot:2285321-Alexandrium_andersonii.AAC.1